LAFSEKRHFGENTPVMKSSAKTTGVFGSKTSAARRRPELRLRGIGRENSGSQGRQRE